MAFYSIDMFERFPFNFWFSIDLCVIHKIIQFKLKEKLCTHILYPPPEIRNKYKKKLNQFQSNRVQP